MKNSLEHLANTLVNLTNTLEHLANSLEHLANTLEHFANALEHLVIQKGITCACCGQSALFYAYPETTPNGSPVPQLIFEHTRVNGQHAFMTVDHILPKSAGGPDCITNYQPACNICNWDKDNHFDVTTLPSHLHQYISPDFKHTVVKPIPQISIVPIVAQIQQNVSPRQVKPNIKLTKFDPYRLLHHEAYIRWYTRCFFKDMPVEIWNRDDTRDIIKKAIKETNIEFYIGEFRQVYHALYLEVISHPSHKQKQNKIKKKNRVQKTTPAETFKLP